MRGFQSQGSTDQAVRLMKQTKVYPLDKASAPPGMQFLNGSKHDIDTIFPDNFHFFEFLADIDEEPLDIFSPFERFQMQAIGIEKGKPLTPDDNTKALLDEAGRLGGAMARSNTPTNRSQRAAITTLVASGKASPAACLPLRKAQDSLSHLFTVQSES